MPRAFLKAFRLPSPRSPRRLHPLPSNHHHLHTSFPRHANVALPLSEDVERPTSRNDPLDTIREQKIRDIRMFLSSGSSTHDHVWGLYVDLIQFYHAEHVPLDIHKNVLRQCTLPAAQMRLAKARYRAWGHKVRETHLHEKRFQAIIRNIRSAGHEPTLEDYHFVLEQFAAVGYVQGSLLVFQELSRMGIQKVPKTYGYCLQAICHYLTLPRWHLRQKYVAAEMSRLCLTLVEDMTRYNVPVTSVNIDLTIRILKETQDMDGFSRLMKMTYGIDLSYPDRPPLEQYDKVSSSGDSSLNALSSLSTPLPFTTAALNTTIETLGRSGDISKLVQTFEVLTTPLPQSDHSSTQFDDDDDDDYSYSSPVFSGYRPPHAEPSTTTYLSLLKWISKAGHAALARHYLLQAIMSDAEKTRRLIVETVHKPRSQILSPSFTVDYRLMLPVFALANRNKKVALMDWVSFRTQRVIRRKKGALKYFEILKWRWGKEARNAAQNPPLLVPQSSRDASSRDFMSSDPALQTFPSSSSSTLEQTDDTVQDALPIIDEQSLTNEEQMTASASPEPVSLDPTLRTAFSRSLSSSPDSRDNEMPSPPMHYFDVDLDEPPLCSPPPPKVFDIDVHIAILRRDIKNLTEFHERVARALGRTIQRIKERLGRRVWRGKSVYLHREGRRMFVNRAMWRSTVNFRPGTATSQSSTGSGWIAATRGLGPKHVKHANDPPDPSTVGENT